MKPSTRRITLALVPLTLVSAAGCVSKKAHEETVASYQAQLAACAEETKLSKEEEAALRRQMEKEDARWQRISEQLASALPQVQADMEAERERIIGLVPTAVRKEVASSLDRHFSKVTSTLLEMNGDVEGLKSQLAEARDEIEVVRGTTVSVGEKVDTTNTTVLTENARLERDLAEQGRAAAALVAKVKTFDEKHLNCADCVDKLKMKDKSREALLDLHGELVKDLSQLQARAGGSTSGQ
jgi:hypothetical protein